MSKARENIPDQGINLLGLNVVHFLDGVLDLLLISPDVDNKHQSVIVFDLLHGRLRGERILEHLAPSSISASAPQQSSAILRPSSP
jgi:hypothetical protein